MTSRSVAIPVNGAATCDKYARTSIVSIKPATLSARKGCSAVHSRRGRGGLLDVLPRSGRPGRDEQQEPGDEEGEHHPADHRSEEPAGGAVRHRAQVDRENLLEHLEAD